MLEIIIGWILGIVVLLLVIIPCVVYNLWRFVCLFRHSCKFKKCPMRATESFSRLEIEPCGCKKCPYPLDEQEAREREEDLQKLKEMIESYCKKSEEEEAAVTCF